MPIIFLMAALLTISSPAGAEITASPVSAVDPFIGTGGYPQTSGNQFPGALVPFGLVRLSPDGAYAPGSLKGWVNERVNIGTSGYYEGYTHLRGFSHTRLAGAGIREGGLFRVTPSLRAVDEAGPKALAVPFTHADEQAEPGYYAVTLPALDGLRAEITATTHVGVHRYTAPNGRPLHLYMDATSSLDGPRDGQDGWIRVIPERGEIEGRGRIFGQFTKLYGGIQGYFVARLDRPVAKYLFWRDGTLLDATNQTAAGRSVGVSIEPEAGGPLEVKVGVSFVSIEAARQNLAKEAGALNFDQVKAQAQAAWEAGLSRVAIETQNAGTRRIFYTALYRAMAGPTNFTDVDGRYLGFGGVAGHAEGFTYRTDMSLWDTFRTQGPLLTLLFPEIQRDVLNSLVQMGQAQGALPMWPSGPGDARCMIGAPAAIYIADAYLKGDRSFAALAALGLIMQDQRGACGGSAGYCPSDLEDQSVSRTLEYAWADASAAQLAEDLGRGDEAALLRQRVAAYKKLWNPSTRFFQPRRQDGSWARPFFPGLTPFWDALLGGMLTKDYTEGSARQWRWSAPFDPAGLIELFGGPAPFTVELQDFMQGAAKRRAAFDPGAEYWHGNEHDLHAPYLFDDAGRPDLTQAWVHWALTTRYGASTDGLDGQDDAGTLSSWYVFSALGFYPRAGSDTYWIGTPAVDGAVLALAGGKVLRIKVRGLSPSSPYVASVSLNGQRLCEPYLRHAQLVGGSDLEFIMTTQPAPRGGFDCAKP